ncbi:MAG: metal-dependent hydrolase, partial [Qipengyuania sp.]
MNTSARIDTPARAAPTPPDLTITVRDERFNRDGKPRRWWAGEPFGTAWHNALSATFPRGEAFFIEAVKAHREGADPRLDAEIRAFVKQEINHTREHIAFNRLAEDHGYDIKAIDKRVEELLALTKGRPPIANLAVTMALEHYT